MDSLYNEELITSGGYRCKDCSKLRHQHTFSGKYVTTGVKNAWGGNESKWVFNSPCDENFWTSPVRYPNLMRVDNIWYHLSSRASMLSLITKADTYLTVEKRDSLISPKPVSIETFGDMYNFCAQNNMLEKLKLIVEPEQFKSMQSKSIERSLKKMSQ